MLSLAPKVSYPDMRKEMQETLCSGDGHWIPECEQLLPDFRKCLSQLIYFDVHYETLLGLNNTQIQDSFTSTGRVLKNGIRHVFEAKYFAVYSPGLHIFLWNLWPKEAPLNHFPSPPLICQIQLGFSCSTACPALRG